MKKLYKYSKPALLIAVLFTLTTCKKNKFLDVNKNPNNPELVGVQLVLPTTEANIGYMMGNQLTIIGGLWAQYWTQDPANGSQYGNYDEYINISPDNDNVWASLYTAATNLNYIIQNADSTQKNYAAIAYFMKAYDFQVITDAFGRVPLSQALKGVSNTSPKYDDESMVYDSLVVWINAGLKIIDASRKSPAEDLIYPGADMTQWQKFANTLLLKIYIRQGQIRPTVAQAGIQALNTSQAQYLSDPTADDAMLRYTTTIYQQYPLYATGVYLQVNELMASNTCLNYMLQLNDTRLTDFYDYASATGQYQGIPQGAWKNLIGQVQDANYSLPNSTEIIAATASVRFLTSSESNFLQAEAAVRGWSPGASSDPATLYAQGVTASWASWINSSTDSSVNAYLVSDSVNFATAATQNQKLRLILTQKWVSMCGNQNFEAWTEWRRTRLPDFFTISQSSVIGNSFPRRMVYPSAEVNNNGSFPGLQPVTAKIWWDVNP
ncbi:MAG: hypothetical protein JWO06_2359 [Bacteroidota bacterium]|nr:hypothetical protein [Bacteroidota bacterium]